MRLKFIRHSVFLLNVFLAIRVNSSTFEDVTSSVLGSHHGLVAAFGDFNANKNTDIFTISDTGILLFIVWSKDLETVKSTGH